MKYKLVIFDFDGTLADSFPWFMQMFNTVADTYRIRRVAAHEVETLRGYGARHIAQQLGVPWWKLALIGRHMRKLAAANTDQIALFPGVDHMLQQLSDAGITLALVTSNSYANARQILGPDNAARIAYYECGVALFGKAARFRRILQQSGVLPRDALCIGDELRDLEAAATAQIPFGAVAWGFTQLAALTARAPTETFTSVHEIIDRLVSAEAART